MRHMKTERENYLKPQTIMEQVAMEQGICSASILETDDKVQAEAHTVGNDYNFNSELNHEKFSFTWD